MARRNRQPKPAEEIEKNENVVEKESMNFDLNLKVSKEETIDEENNEELIENDVEEVLESKPQQVVVEEPAQTVSIGSLSRAHLRIYQRTGILPK